MQVQFKCLRRFLRPSVRPSLNNTIPEPVLVRPNELSRRTRKMKRFYIQYMKAEEKVPTTIQFFSLVDPPVLSPFAAAGAARRAGEGKLLTNRAKNMKGR